MDNFDLYNVLLSIATNIPVLLMTAFVLQGHICYTECTCALKTPDMAMEWKKHKTRPSSASLHRKAMEKLCRITTVCLIFD